MEAFFVLGLLVVVMVLFATEVLTVDLVTLLALLALVMVGILTPQEAFSGFGSEIIVILGSVFVITGSLRETGTLDRVGTLISNLSSGGPGQLVAVLMGAVSAMSAFVNNTTVTALLVGPVLGLGRARGINASKLLIPLAFASIIGGTCTLIGTSTNVAVSGFLNRTGLEPIGFFELTPIGVILVITGIAYMVLVGRRFLPDYPEPKGFAEAYELRDYLSEVVIKKNSPLIGKSLKECAFAKMDLRVMKVLRGNFSHLARPSQVLKENDVLLVSGPVASLMKVREAEGIEIRPDVKYATKVPAGTKEILEVLVTPQSEMRGRMIEELDLPGRFGITVLAVNHHGRRLRDKIKTVRLDTGDLLLVQGTADRMEALRASSSFAVLTEHTTLKHRDKKGLLVLGFLGAAVAVSAFDLLPVSAALLAAAVAAVLIGSMPTDRLYRVVEWRLLILIAGMTAFAIAMEKTGAAQLVSGAILALLNPFGLTALLLGFIVITVILTQPMSNAAAALVVLPVAIATAEQLGVNARTFVMGITYAASVSLIAPFEPSCLLVYGPGRYKLMDFLKAGAGITCILVVLILILVPLWWPFYPR